MNQILVLPIWRAYIFDFTELCFKHAMPVHILILNTLAFVINCVYHHVTYNLYIHIYVCLMLNIFHRKSSWYLRYLQAFL